ncbi:MAG: hypothetical protein U0441_24690 [Polyangiaceae bacterium]
MSKINWLSHGHCLLVTIGLFVPVAAAGCEPPTDSDPTEDVESAELAIGAACARAHEAKRLYREETFGGNGRTCLTCHGDATGTLNPSDVQARFAANPNDPLFEHDGLDTFDGQGTTRILANATILVPIKLPPNIQLADDPTATKIFVQRGVPTTKNSPALDPVIMYDGRAASLTGQAKGAIFGHAQATIQPTADQLQMISEHEKSSSFFSSWDLRNFADGGPPPAMPSGNSPSQMRGRKFFVDTPVPFALNAQSSRQGLCAQCHSGPLLNQTNGLGHLPLPPFPTAPAQTSCSQPATGGNPVPAGERFSTALVSELNEAQTPTFNFLLKLPSGDTVPLPPMADPGRALVTGNFKGFPAVDGDLFKFKIPILRGVKKTAPYFHDNSAKTLEEVVAHYATFFQLATDCNIDGDPPLILTAQDQADIVAYLKLL